MSRTGHRPLSLDPLVKPMKLHNHAMYTDRTSSRVATECAYDIVHYVTNKRTAKLKPACTKYSEVLRRTVDNLRTKHEIWFTSAMRRLEVGATNERVHAIIDNVANEMFSDRQFNWGRLAALYAFTGTMAKHCLELDSTCTALVENIASYTAEYMAENLSGLIKETGGWDAFVEYFEPETAENKIWKGLLCTVVGLGALATMVAVR